MCVHTLVSLQRWLCLCVIVCVCVSVCVCVCYNGANRINCARKSAEIEKNPFDGGLYNLNYFRSFQKPRRLFFFIKTDLKLHYFIVEQVNRFGPFI